VRVLWTRQDELVWEPKSPAMVFDVRGAVDASGNVLAFDLEGWSPSHSTGEIGNFLAWRLVGGNPSWDRLSGGGGNLGYAGRDDRRCRCQYRHGRRARPQSRRRRFLRTHHQPAGDAVSTAGRAAPGLESVALRRGEVPEQPRHERRLAVVPDFDVPGRSGS